MALNVSVGLRPSGPTSLVSLSICCLIPATRISKNSSRFELKMVRNFTRSMSGCVASCASSRTRRLNSSQLSSRLMKFCGAESFFAGASVPAPGRGIMLVAASGDEDSTFGCIDNSFCGAQLLADPDRARETLQNAFAFRFRGCARWPTFHNFERQKAKQRQAGKFQVEPQILGNLLDRS